MMPAVYIAGGMVAGGLLMFLVLTPPTNDSACCRKIATVARDEISTRTGGGKALADIFDLLGITNHLPTIVDKAGL